MSRACEFFVPAGAQVCFEVETDYGTAVGMPIRAKMLPSAQSEPEMVVHRVPMSGLYGLVWSGERAWRHLP